MDLGTREKITTNNAAKSKSPIFKINERTNATINERRLKFSSIRQKNVNHIIRQTKLQGLEPNIEHDELTAIETKIEEIQNKILDKKSKKSKAKRR